MSLFSKRHYVWLASALRDEVQNIKLDKGARDYPYGYEDGFRNSLEQLGKSFKSDNPEFDEELFLDNIYNKREIKTSLEK